jgi:sporulation protein YlmC with PRC-barrel domain
MNRTIASVTTALLMLAPLCPAAFAQGAVQTAGLMSIDPATVTVGYRATKVVGSDVTDAAGTKLGTVDDLIITSADQVPYAVLSVGGFLGIGEKHVLVRASNLDVVNARIVLAGGTKASLTALPPYLYTK